MTLGGVSPGPRFERARPVFDDGRREFHPITRLAGYRHEGDSVLLQLETEGGQQVQGRLTMPAPDACRLQWRHGAAPDEHLTEMLVGPPPRLALTVVESGGVVTVSCGGAEVHLELDPWRVVFGGYRGEPRDQAYYFPVTRGSGWAIEDGRVQAYETFALAAGEELFGLGERFTGPRLRGGRYSHWIWDTRATNTTDFAYKSVPLVVSSRGYGLFFHHPEEGVFELGAYSTASATALFAATEIDLFIFLGDPKRVLRGYTELTGRAPVPPEWSFGTWMSRCMYRSRDEVIGVLDEAERLGIGVDVVNLDPLWLEQPPGATVNSCTFRWSEERFGPMEAFIAELHGRGVRLCLWVNPYVHETSPVYDPANLVDGGATRRMRSPSDAFVDFTGPGGRWWQEQSERLVAAGVDALKLDFGEELPPSGRMADGRGGDEVHNLYPLLVSRAAADAGVPVSWTRAATAGSQRYPLHWSADAQSTWAGMAGSLRGGLALAWSGFAHWTTDIGGFYWRNLDIPISPDYEAGVEPPDPELFVRWMQYGMLCSHTRFHGILPREPWHFGDAAVEVARVFGDLRRQLRPYLLRCAEEAAASGTPVLRPLAMEFPEDPSARAVDTQYMLGPDLLVCPVLEPGGNVEAYIPRGEWTDHFTGEVAIGPTWRRWSAIPLGRLPLLVRAGGDPFAGA